MSLYNPKLVKKFEKIRALHKPGERFDSGDHFAAVAALPLAEQSVYITWSAQLPVAEQPLATPAVNTPMTRDEYISRLRHLEPLDAEKRFAFTSQTQSWINGAPPSPLPLGWHGDEIYALKSQTTYHGLKDEKEIDPRDDWGRRDGLIRFMSTGKIYIGPKVGTSLGRLVARLRNDEGSGSWKDTHYDVVISALDKSVWVMYCPIVDYKGSYEAVKMFPRDEGDMWKVFDGITEMITAIEKNGTVAMSGVVVPGKPQWYVVRDEDLKLIQTSK